MKSLAHFLAEAANFNADGTFSVYNGGITDLNTPGFPAFGKVTILTRLELSEDEAKQLNEMRVRISYEGKELGMARQPLATPTKVDPAKPIYVNSIANLNLMAPGPGRITIEAWVNEMALPLLYLTAVQVPA